MTGTVKRLVRDRGFGFIRDDVSGMEYFFHRSAVQATTFEALNEGVRVHYDTEDSMKGPRAANVRPA